MATVLPDVPSASSPGVSLLSLEAETRVLLEQDYFLGEVGGSVAMICCYDTFPRDVDPVGPDYYLVFLVVVVVMFALANLLED